MKVLDRVWIGLLLTAILGGIISQGQGWQFAVAMIEGCIGILFFIVALLVYPKS